MTSTASNYYEVKFLLLIILYQLLFSLIFGTMEAMKNKVLDCNWSWHKEGKSYLPMFKCIH